jgi:hypothetical protein
MNIQLLQHRTKLVLRRLFYEMVFLPTKLRAFLLNARVPRDHYEIFGERDIKKSVKGNTLFILASGSSLASIPDEVLSEMKQNTTMSLNYTLLQSFIPADFHVVRELGAANDISVDIRLSDLNNFGELMASNPCYEQTVFLIQGGYAAWVPNLLLGHRSVRKGTKIFRYRNQYIPGFTSLGTSFSAGIAHGASTVIDCINMGYILGFKKIVLCGVDLYDRKYFWHIPNTSFIPLPGITDAKIGEYGNSGDQTPKHRSANGLLEQISRCDKELKASGVVLSVLNPHSLLAEILPVHTSLEDALKEPRQCP